MGNINQSYFDRIRYTLYTSSQGSIEIDEPIGWTSDEKELARHEQYHGIISRFSNSLKFIGSGKDFIQLVYDIEGINAEIKMKREEKHPHSDIWTLTYSGYLDLSTWETEKNQISIKFNSGGIEQALKARESEKIEIDRITTIDGKKIPELQPITVALDGRRIFLKSKWEVPTVDNIVNLFVVSSDGNTRKKTGEFPLALKTKSHEEAQNTLNDSEGSEFIGATGMMFLANNVIDKNITVIGSDLKFIPVVNKQQINRNTFIRVCFSVYNNGSNFNLKSRTVLLELKATNNEDISYVNNKTYSIPDFQMNLNLKVGESLAMEYFIDSDLANGTGNKYFDVTFTTKSGMILINEDSFFEKSQTKAILAHELVDRLVTIGTNKENAFYSDFLGRTDIGYMVDGPGAFTGLSHGFWVRGFDKLPIPTESPKVENLFKPLTTSFKDAIASLDAVWNVGIGIETFGLKERIRLEELSFFYNNNVTIRLPFQVKNLKRSVATNYYYSSLEFGSEKGGDYQEAMGLDEPNTKANFTTVITRAKEIYSKISKYRSDSYGMEFARRKPKTLNDTEDTSYDSDIFNLDLKRGIGSVFEQRKWQDDFEKEPTGIFNPETATNLRFSPFNCLVRHSWWFGGGFKKYLSDYVSYGSSTANSQLKTKFIGKPEYAENGNVKNSDLLKARFFPEWIEFEHTCNFEVMQMVEGKTVILGKEIMNFYGLVEFINENSEKEKGFLFNLKPNGKGQWKLLKSNR
ncbi:hypothetical protein [Flavobacterium sp.]|uniref:hypothetical protein n=1 Tax=Flavobacterium sp. TaxID=239 RepID=UPI003752EB06